MVEDCSTESPALVTEIIEASESRRPVFILEPLKYRKKGLRLEFLDNHLQGLEWPRQQRIHA